MLHLKLRVFVINSAQDFDFKNEGHWTVRNRTTDKQSKCEVDKQVEIMDLSCSSVTKMHYLRPVLNHSPVASQHQPQFTLEQSMFMVVNFKGTNGR